MTRIPLPDGFILGVATSAYQIEGAIDVGGRGASIWDTFSQTPGKTAGDVPGDAGADGYDRLEEDLDILLDLGVQSYRFSISWSRLIPDGTGAVSPEGAAFYDRVINGLIARGITPNVTLYHWDLPQTLQDRGGWADRAIVEWFAYYARTAFTLFGDRVRMWATLNEPIAIWVGYGLGTFPPGIADALTGKTAMHHAMLAHGRAVQEFRALGIDGSVGIVIDVWKRHAITETAENHQLVDRDEDDSFRFFFDALFAGGLSERLVRRLQKDGTMPAVQPGDAGITGTPMDFLGLNVYGRVLVDAENYDPAWWKQDGEFPGGNYLSNGIELYPEALIDAVRIVRDDYAVTLPIYITENGTTADDGEIQDGVKSDDDRIAYLSAFLAKAVEAHELGLGVEGYYAWTLMDNYEWTAAYTARFGLVDVDVDGSFDRTYKKSAYWFKQLAQDRILQMPAPEGDA